ncbi:hypothetical protein B0H21DRAFT_73526 [Amylocystis lapponica]|nr:hypothetical protein B0H21DRAFT_73526 [Amylocystis lapponica]
MSLTLSSFAPASMTRSRQNPEHQCIKPTVGLRLVTSFDTPSAKRSDGTGRFGCRTQGLIQCTGPASEWHSELPPCGTRPKNNAFITGFDSADPLSMDPSSSMGPTIVDVLERRSSGSSLASWRSTRLRVPRLSFGFQTEQSNAPSASVPSATTRHLHPWMAFTRHSNRGLTSCRPSVLWRRLPRDSEESHLATRFEVNLNKELQRTTSLQTDSSRQVSASMSKHSLRS